MARLCLPAVNWVTESAAYCTARCVPIICRIGRKVTCLWAVWSAQVHTACQVAAHGHLTARGHAASWPLTFRPPVARASSPLVRA